MTQQVQTTTPDELKELLAEHGFVGIAREVTVLLNEVMKLERAHALRAGPYERSGQRTGYAGQAVSAASKASGSRAAKTVCSALVHGVR
jgi:hypothetical protein